MRKNEEGREHALLSKIYGSNPTFQCQIARFKRLGGLGRAKIREQGGRNERSLSQGNLGVGFESELGTMDLGSKVGAETHGSYLGARVRGADLPATSALLGCPVLTGQASRRRATAPTPRVQRSIYVAQGVKRKFSSKKGQNTKKTFYFQPDIINAQACLRRHTIAS
jgi:hypothetical protein